MKQVSNPDTEQKIFDAAQKVFVEKGFHGARMQMIADEAGINKALLHYYFRSKEKLFDEIFKHAFLQIAPKIIALLQSKEPIKIKIKLFIDGYVDTLVANPHIPIFIFNELAINPIRITEMLQGVGLNPDTFIQQINKEKKKGELRNFKAEHLIVNLLSMCLFPFVARPIMQGILFNNNAKAFDKFLKERKKEVYDTIIYSIYK